MPNRSASVSRSSFCSLHFDPDTDPDPEVRETPVFCLLYSEFWIT
jgi:hypothetical protein